MRRADRSRRARAYPPRGTPAQPAAGCDNLCAAAAALIERFELREAPTPVRERKGWAPPKRIVVADVEIADALRGIAPGVEVVGVPGLRNFAAMTEAVAGADVLIGLCTPGIIERGQGLKWIQLLNAGADSCATVPAVAQRDIVVTNLQRIQGPHMAEHAVALMLALARALPQYEAEQIAGAWSRGFRELREERLREVEGKTLLVVGLGGIGTEVAKRAHALGMHVIATRNSRREGPDYVEYVGSRTNIAACGARGRGRERDAVDARDARHVRRAVLRRDEGRRVLHQHRARRERRHRRAHRCARAAQIGGAGLDVTDPEPLPPGHPLWGMRNVIITPHVATS